MIVSFFTPLIQVIYGIPLAVIGGLEIYLFGAIAAQGIAIMIEKKVDMFSSKNIAVIASIMIIGIGGNYAFGGNIPFFGLAGSLRCRRGNLRHSPEPSAQHRREKESAPRMTAPLSRSACRRTSPRKSTTAQ